MATDQTTDTKTGSSALLEEAMMGSARLDAEAHRLSRAMRRGGAVVSVSYESFLYPLFKSINNGTTEGLAKLLEEAEKSQQSHGSSALELGQMREDEWRDLKSSRGEGWVDHGLDNVLVLLITHRDGFLSDRERVMRTWGKHCPHLLTVLGVMPEIPDGRKGQVTDVEKVHLVGGDIDGYKALYKKMLKTYMWLCGAEEAKPYSWFIKFDTDAFLVTYNLAAALNAFDSPDTKPYYVGQRMLYKGKDYASGGAGYMMSKGLMATMCQPPVSGGVGSSGWENCYLQDLETLDFWVGAEYWGRPEDLYIGLCIQKHAGVQVTSVAGFDSSRPQWAERDENEFYRMRSLQQPPVITLHYITKLFFYQLYAAFY